MLGFGFRLDTAWQGLAALLLALGGASAGTGLWMFWRRQGASAFVPPGSEG
jgi:hypothetical protein